MSGVLENKKSTSQISSLPRLKNRKLYRILMMLQNKKGSLAKVSLMLADRGAGIENLDFKPSSKAGLAELDLTISIKKEQLQGILNDAQRMTEIRSASLKAEKD
ncbi:MAG: ACT domain-containing protein [Oligoflexales bacterium]